MTLVSLLFSIQSLFAGEIIIATAAQVRDHVITTREVKIQYVLDRALERDWYVENGRDPVEQLVREWLLYFEANGFYNSKLPEQRTSDLYQRLLPVLAKVKGWKELEVSSNELKGFLRRKLEADRLYKFKKKASRLPVSDSEVEAEYKQNRIRYGTSELVEVKEKIRMRKSKENLHQRLVNWFAVLETKYKVQRFAQYNAN